jgi:hypothetical protein
VWGVDALRTVRFGVLFCHQTIACIISLLVLSCGPPYSTSSTVFDRKKKGLADPS